MDGDAGGRNPETRGSHKSSTATCCLASRRPRSQPSTTPACSPSSAGCTGRASAPARFATWLAGFVGSAFETSDASDAGVSGGLAVEINAALMHSQGTRWLAVAIGLFGILTAGRSLAKTLTSASCLTWHLSMRPHASVRVTGALVGLVGGLALVSALVNRIRVDLGIAAAGAGLSPVRRHRRHRRGLHPRAGNRPRHVRQRRRFRTIRQHHTSGVPTPRSARPAPSVETRPPAPRPRRRRRARARRPWFAAGLALGTSEQPAERA